MVIIITEYYKGTPDYHIMASDELSELPLEVRSKLEATTDHGEVIRLRDVWQARKMGLLLLLNDQH